MNGTEHLNYVLVITSCLTGFALILLSVRVAFQVLKHHEIWWDGFTLITSWVGLSSIVACFKFGLWD